MKFNWNMADAGKRKGSPDSGSNTKDRIILAAARFGIGSVKADKSWDRKPYGSWVRVGNILFDCNSHSTGNSLMVYVINEDESEALIVRSLTYWTTYGYNFNESYVLPGAWDKAINEAYEFLEVEIEKERAQLKIQREAEQQERERSEKELAQRFEKQFA